MYLQFTLISLIFLGIAMSSTSIPSLSTKHILHSFLYLSAEIVSPSKKMLEKITKD